MNPDQAFSIEIEGGVTVCVPADINLMTPYILLEQEDWFEDEIKFVRAFLQPGMRVIDIGVNYGTYFLTAANRIGDTGKIWGFEPSAQCVGFVESSIAKNGFRNTQLIDAGLSNRTGAAYLATSDNTELNTVAEKLDEGERGDSISLLTLDECLHDLDLNGIDFMKMDAEGEESNILLGGKEFFECNSPLVMFELKHADKVNTKLIGEFNEIGYQTFKLIPGLGRLVSFEVDDPIDGYQLNLFACKPDRLVGLRAGGWLVEPGSESRTIEGIGGVWKEYILQFPYAQELSEILGDDIDRSTEKEFVNYYRALDLFAWSKNNAHDAESRYKALSEAYALLGALMKTQGNMSIALTLVRVATEIGERQAANGLLSQLVNAVQKGQEIGLPVPFLAPCKEFDSIPFGQDLEHWLYSSIFTANQFLSAFSSYYMHADNRTLLDLIENLRFVVPEIRRRRMLTALRFSQSIPYQGEPSVAALSEKNGNRNIWSDLVG